MAFTDQITQKFYAGGITAVIFIVVGIMVILAIALVLWFLFMKKRWNLKTEFKMVRSDGRVTIPEWGKGRYDQHKGIIWVKRKRKKAEAIKAQRLDTYLQGANTVTVVGNPGNWLLVVPDTYLEIEDDVTHEKAAVVNLRADTREDKSWSTVFERMANQTFTIQSFMSEYGQFLGWGFILLVIIIGQFVGFSMVLGKIKGG